MISELFKSICNDAPKRVIKRHDVEESRPRLTRYQAQVLKNYRAEQERLERKRKEMDDIALLARLVHESRQRRRG